MLRTYIFKRHLQCERVINIKHTYKKGGGVWGLVTFLKSNENIHKKEDGPYYAVSANKASSVTL